MPKKLKGTSSRKRGSTMTQARRKTRSKTTTSRRARTTRGSKTSVHRTGPRRSTGVTYVFECTRQGCGYQIVREEKAEAGKLRFDLKCPKCHNREFKCLGPGDLSTPELENTIPATEISFDNPGTLSLGSN